MKYLAYISYDMAKKRTLSDLIRDEVIQSLSIANSCSGASLKTSAPEQKHWVETYSPSKRKAYYYYRYVWMEGRLLKHKHLPGGNNSSPKAKSIKELVEGLIALGKSPTEIITLIQSEKLLVSAVTPRQTSP